MTAKRTSASSKKSVITRILKKIAITLSVIAGCLFLLYAVVMGYENISQHIVYKEAEQLLNDPMGRKDLLGMKLRYTFISPRNNVGLLQIKPSSRQSAKNTFELPPDKSPNDTLNSLQKAAANANWTITDVNDDCNYSCSFVARKNGSNDLHLDVIIVTKGYLSDYNNTVSVSIRKE